LYWAVAHGDTNIVKLLLENGADSTFGMVRGRPRPLVNWDVPEIEQGWAFGLFLPPTLGHFIFAGGDACGPRNEIPNRSVPVE